MLKIVCYTSVLQKNHFIRLSEHLEEKWWWRKVSRITIEHFKNRELAAIAEKNAIMTELPAYNKIYNPRFQAREKRRRARSNPQRLAEIAEVHRLYLDSEGLSELRKLRDTQIVDVRSSPSSRVIKSQCVRNIREEYENRRTEYERRFKVDKRWDLYRKP